MRACSFLLTIVNTTDYSERPAQCLKNQDETDEHTCHFQAKVTLQRKRY